MRSLLATTAILVLAMTTTAAEAKGKPCDRTCLEGVLTRYLDAIVKHDPGAAPLAAGYRHTENAKAIATGNGVWKSITGVGKLRRHFIDAQSESVGFYGTFMEGENGMIVTLRLRTEDSRVTEAEWYIARSNDPSAPPPGPGLTNMVSIAGAEMSQPALDPLPKDRRVPRRVMIAAANAYFDALQTGDESLIPGAPNWLRIENGFGTGRGAGGGRFDGAGMFAGKAPEEPVLAPPGPGGCPMICNVAARRYPIVDEEAGVVLALVVFERPPGFPLARNLLSEWFTLDGGKITGIYAAMYFLSPGSPAPNWPPYGGNFPVSNDAPAQKMPSLPAGIPQTAPAPPPSAPAHGAVTGK